MEAITQTAAYQIEDISFIKPSFTALGIGWSGLDILTKLQAHNPADSNYAACVDNTVAPDGFTGSVVCMAGRTEEQVMDELGSLLKYQLVCAVVGSSQSDLRMLLMLVQGIASRQRKPWIIALVAPEDPADWFAMLVHELDKLSISVLIFRQKGLGNQRGKLAMIRALSIMVQDIFNDNTTCSAYENNAPWKTTGYLNVSTMRADGIDRADELACWLARRAQEKWFVLPTNRIVLRIQCGRERPMKFAEQNKLSVAVASSELPGVSTNNSQFYLITFSYATVPYPDDRLEIQVVRWTPFDEQ